MAGSLHLEVVTSERPVYSGAVTFVSAPGAEGVLGILPNHASLLATLQPGELRFQPYDGNGEITMAVGGGFIEVHRNRVVVLAHSAERAGEIDVERALQARERALLRLRDRYPEVDLERARQAMRRAEARLRVARKRGKAPLEGER